MKLPLFQVKQYIEYYLKKEDQHSLQSPFAYQMYQGLREYLSKNVHLFPAIEQMRQELLQDKRKLRINDFGAGSHKFSSPDRRISDIVRFSCSKQKYAILNQFFCSLTPARTVVELGTCLGLNTCYLAEVTKKNLYTFEGADALIKRVMDNLQSYKSIQVIEGDISKTLPVFLEKGPRVDFAFLDANHTYDSTMSYFRQLSEHTHQGSIIVIGDIHWSREMNRAWKEIIRSKPISWSFDFYECGVLFFREGIEKVHHILHI